MTLTTKLFDTDRPEGSSVGVLSAMFRKILTERNVGPSAWDRLMTRYMDDPRLAAQGDTRERTSLRSNMNNALTDRDMTIKTFLRGLAFLRPVKIAFAICLTFPDDHPLTRLQGKVHELEIDVPIDITGNSGSSLLRQWYGLIEDPLAITESERLMLTEVYLDDPRNAVSKDPDRRASTKGNVLKYFRSSRLSWINFHRCLLFLRPKTITFDVFLVWRLTYTETRHRLKYKTAFKALTDKQDPTHEST